MREPLQKPPRNYHDKVCGGVSVVQGWGMKQLTLATAGFVRYAKTTRQTAFLAEMGSVVP